MKPTRLLLLTLTILLLFGTQLAAITAQPPIAQYALRVPADQTADWQRLGIAPEKVLDYGSFQWVILNPDDLPALDAAQISAPILTNAYELQLGGLSFDPLFSAPIIEDLPQTENLSAQKDLRLVQFVGPIRVSWLDELQSHQLQIVQYIHPFTYVVWGTRANLEIASQASFVRWQGDFAPQYRLLPHYRNLPEATLATNLLLYRGADTPGLMLAIQRMGGELLSSGVMDQTFEIAQFNLSGSTLAQVAQLPGVYSVQPVRTDGGLRGEMSSQVNAGNYDTNNLAFVGYQDWLAELGLSGAGVIVADVDSGVDHDHPDLINNMLPCSGSSCAGSTQSAHGTHTAGIIAADGASGIVDTRGFLRGLGVAPGANLIEQLYSPTFSLENGMLTLIQQSFANGALLSSNSWGPAATPQGYDADTRQVDVGVRDADPLTPGNQSFSYMLSIMNGNGGTSSQGSPDEAKNIITVGSTKMQMSSGSQYLDINNLSYNSAHGPALDGRIIPHIVAPGCYVDSTTINSYGMMCGTSMSSPQLSGTAALFIEYYRNHFGVDPSPALIKAAILPVAHDLAGFQDADGVVMGHRFNSQQGWGRLNLSAVLDPLGDVFYYDAPQIFDTTGEQWQTTLNLADVGTSVRIMLVWTDAPGHGLGGTTPAWNNDLDLTVSAGGVTYYGNNFDPLTGWSQPGMVSDPANNTEGVMLETAPGGWVTVTVTAANINSDGVPDFGDDTDQDFALVIYTGQYIQYYPIAFSAK